MRVPVAVITVDGEDGGNHFAGHKTSSSRMSVRTLRRY
jgi:hypothetical protein